MMKKSFFFLMLSVLSVGAWADNPTSWNNPYLPSAKSGQQYAIRYTTDAMSHDANSAWMKVGYDDSNWTLGAGPVGSSGYGVPSGTAALGTSIDSPSGDRFIRREFTLDRDLSGKTIYMACGHDDEGAIWIDGTQIISWSNVYDDKYVHTMTSEQTALLTKGKHVIAIWAKNNSGGYYWDCGLYGDDLSTNLDWGKNTSWTAKYKNAGSTDAADPTNDAAGYGWTNTIYNDADWSTMAMPCGSAWPQDNKGTKWEGENNRYWFRRPFLLTSIDKTKTYTLQFVHDDDYEIYINGKLLRSETGWHDNYSSPKYCIVPAEDLNVGENVIAARVTQFTGGSLFDCRLIATTASTPTVTFTGTASDNRFENRKGHEEMLDGDLDTKWEAWPNWSVGDSETGHYGFNDDNGNILFKTSTPIYVNGLTLYTAGDTQKFPKRNPYEWTLFGSNDDAAETDDTHSSWVIIENIKNAQMPTTNKTGKYYEFIPCQTAYKYFKFHVNRLVGQDELQLAELKLDYTLTPKTPQITVIADGGNKPGYGETSAKIFDGQCGTKWYKEAGSNWVVFKTSKPIYASSYIIQTANDEDSRDPKTFQLYGALDAAPTTDGSTTGWTEIDREDDASGTISTERYSSTTFSIDKPSIYQYFLLKIDESRSNYYALQFSEFFFNDAIEVETYNISNPTELANLAKRVNSGEGRVIAKITNDIVADGNFASIGTTTNKFGGIFDGQGHTITINVGSGSEYQGLIGCAENAACISNVIVKGSVAGPSRCGGILGGSNADTTPSGTVTLFNCGNEANVTVTGQNAGGVVGCNRNGSLVYKLINCYNAGTIKGGSESAGISGWLKNNAIVTNCYNIGNVTGVDGTKTFARWDSGTYTNCYNTLAANEFAGRTDSYPMEKVSSGELCYNLNGNANAGTNFYQNLAPNTADAHPIPFSTHKAVYRNQETPTAIYSNYDIALVDGKYQIYDAATLNNFSEKVNEGYTILNAELTADVNMTGQSYTPIGNDTNMFAGTIDGSGHKINLDINASSNQQALIGVATDGATIQNLILTGNVKNTGSKTGGFIAEAKVGGTITITNCGNEAKIEGAGGETAAIVANNWGYRCTLNISNVYNIGDVSGTSDVASICACQGNSSSTFTNVYNSGSVSGDKEGKFVRNSPGTYTNCYSTSLTSSDNGNINLTNDTEITSGELCYNLGAAFTQDLRQAGHPTFGSNAVTAGQWFSDANDVYYNKVGDDYTVYQLNLNEENTKYAVPDDGTVTAKNISVARTIPDGQWIGLCLPFDYDIPSGWDVREMTGVSGSGEEASMKFSTASTIEAGKPYIVRPTSAVETPITAVNKTIAANTTDVSISGITMKGRLKQDMIHEGDFYINTSSLLKKLNVSEVALKGFRAYFTVDGSSVKALSFDFDDDATGINAIDNEQLTIDNAPIYNVAGQRLNKMQKGINIINGKKFLK